MAEFDLKKSAEKIGQLYPVLLDRDGKIIDGFHRKKVIPDWWERVYDGDDPYLALIHANWHRRSISKDEKTRWLINLCEAHPDWDQGEGFTTRLGKETGFDIATIQRYLPIKYQSKRGRGKKKRTPQAEEFKYEFNVWEAEPKRPEGYGDKSFEGNTPPLLAHEAILRYTNEGDTIFDPMAGSGTITDLCKELNRHCIARDILPMRRDIEQGDARNTGLDDNSIDFIFAHFPYWNMYVYSSLDGDLSRMKRDEFMEESERIIVEAYRILKPERYYAVLIGDQRKERQVIDWSAEFSLIGQRHFTLHDKVIWYAHGQRSYQSPSYYDELAAQYNFCKATFDTLLVFRRD